MSEVFIIQNLFYQGRGRSYISLNSHYIVRFKKIQGPGTDQKVYPENLKYLKEVCTDTTRDPHGYLLIYLKKSTPKEMNIRSAIFPDDPVN